MTLLTMFLKVLPLAIVEEAVKLTEGRSEIFVILLMFGAMMGWKEWRDWKLAIAKDKHDLEVAKDNANSLKLIGDSAATTGEATELIAATIATMEKRQERDRRAILSVIDSMESRFSGDDSRADQSLRDARSILIAGD